MLPFSIRIEQILISKALEQEAPGLSSDISIHKLDQKKIITKKQFFWNLIFIHTIDFQIYNMVIISLRSRKGESGVNDSSSRRTCLCLVSGKSMSRRKTCLFPDYL